MPKPDRCPHCGKSPADPSPDNEAFFREVMSRVLDSGVGTGYSKEDIERLCDGLESSPVFGTEE
jgi:hypothetical protein